MLPDMPQPSPSPKDFDPVAAGRLGLWLLSRRSHRAASRRKAFPTRDSADTPQATLSWRFAYLLLPWRIYEYPGSIRFLSELLGIAPSYARNLLKPSWDKKLPAKHARALANYLEKRASQCEALAHELRDYAGKAERSKIYDKSALRRRRDMR